MDFFKKVMKRFGIGRSLLDDSDNAVGPVSPLAVIRPLGVIKPVGTMIVGGSSNIGTTGKGKSFLPPEVAEGEKMLPEYRRALFCGLSLDPEDFEHGGDDYELACVTWLVGLRNVGVAFNVDRGRAYLMVANTSGAVPDYTPTFLLDAAKELTEFLRTFVIPDQESDVYREWDSNNCGPIIVYKFKFADAPKSIHFS